MEKNSSEQLERVQSQMRKGVLEYCILLILQHRQAYTGELLSALKEGNLLVVEGTLYPLLNRLRKDGLLDYSWAESTQGPPRKYYQITEEGRAFLVQMGNEWSTLVASVEHIATIGATEEAESINVIEVEK